MVSPQKNVSAQLGTNGARKRLAFWAYAIPDEDLDLLLLVVRDYVIPGRREVLLQALRD